MVKRPKGWARSFAVCIVVLIFGITVATASSANVTGGTVGTGDFTYDGQTVPQSAWPNMGDASGGKLQWIKSPLTFDCANGTLMVSDKKEYGGEQLTDTFTAPTGKVLVGVLIHSGINFTIDTATSTWASDGSSATIDISKGYSNSAIFYCTPVPPPTGSVHQLFHRNHFGYLHASRGSERDMHVHQHPQAGAKGQHHARQAPRAIERHWSVHPECRGYSCGNQRWQQRHRDGQRPPGR
jgi:hypothetical protein